MLFWGQKCAAGKHFGAKIANDSKTIYFIAYSLLFTVNAGVLFTLWNKEQQNLLHLQIVTYANTIVHVCLLLVYVSIEENAKIKRDLATFVRDDKSGTRQSIEMLIIQFQCCQIELNDSTRAFFVKYFPYNCGDDKAQKPKGTAFDFARNKPCFPIIENANMFSSVFAFILCLISCVFVILLWNHYRKQKAVQTIGAIAAMQQQQEPSVGETDSITS
ncbi:unnamed protein product [Didymodactylos carnosus]|uniref:Uncharacterized protein n=1 Tax=Didymodactylos carnosus TaxID=1234261 RepID=A0A815JLA8_9BILA|nr:unnamed protein product [Didymodactylos carnosus]CAF4278732.1 unnamed protein product [Didymodactylos carnosus]